MPRPEWRNAVKEKRWRRLLQQWRRSGLTGRDFCAEHRLAEPSFYFWKREIARRDQERLPRTPPSPAAPTSLTTSVSVPFPLQLSLSPLQQLARLLVARGREA